MSSGAAELIAGAAGSRVKASCVCACGSLDVVARAMCPRCLARQHHDKEYFGGYREQVLARDGWICQGCFYRPSQQDRDFIVVHHRVPGLSRPELMISLCAACHAIVERLHVLRSWLPPQLVILWREQHPDAAYQLQFDLGGNGGRDFNPRVVEIDL